MRPTSVAQNLRPTPEQPNSDTTEREHQSQGENNIWTEIHADLSRIEESLKKKNAQEAQEISRVIARVEQATQSTRQRRGLESRLERIETLLQAKERSPVQGPQTPASWAKVATHGMRLASEPQATRQAHHTIRVQMPQAKGKKAEEILKEIKRTISGAAAIRMLRSGDIDVTLPNEEAKDRAQCLPSTDDLKIIRQDYLIEIPGVPLTIQVANGRNADNGALAAQICEESKSIAPGLQITRIRWLHDLKLQSSRRVACEQRAKTRGSLIIGVQTQTMQSRAVRGGLVINAEYFGARQFERSLQVAQCFKCQQWGHTQSACGKQAKCGQCAGSHSTRECEKQTISCVNCGKGHRAWQRRECPTFGAYFQGIQSRRVALYAQAVSMRAESPQSSGRTSPASQSQAGWTVMARKRQRGQSPNIDDTQRRIGRPTHIEQASRDPAQQRLSLSQRTAGETQGTGTLNAPIVEIEMTQNE